MSKTLGTKSPAQNISEHNKTQEQKLVFIPQSSLNHKTYVLLQACQWY